MNNFGVIEVASTKTTHAPGWAYVTDTAGPSNPSKSVSAVHLHVNRNKRAARQGATGGAAAAHHSDVSARHDAKLQKEIEQLQRDSLGGGAAQIPIPGGGGGGGGRDRDGKMRGHTPNVRKILASQKTFANHLDDFEAWSRAQAGAGEGGGNGIGGGGAAAATTAGSAGHSAAGTPVPAPAAGGSKRAAAGGAAQRKGGASSAAAAAGGGSRGRSTNNSRKPSAPTPAPDPDVTMTDAPPPRTEENPESDTAAAKPRSLLLRPFTRFTPPAHPGDSDPLLESWLPPLPTDDELCRLMRAPPLSYNQARGTWAEDDPRYPPRHFCEVCGYWGRVRCMKCGTRVCALDCLDVHREECITRYGL